MSRGQKKASAIQWFLWLTSIALLASNHFDANPAAVASAVQCQIAAFVIMAMRALHSDTGGTA